MLSPVQQDSNQQRTHDDATFAVAALTAEQFVDRLIDEAKAHRAVHHPYLAALSGGAIPDAHGAIVDFARI